MQKKLDKKKLILNLAVTVIVSALAVFYLFKSNLINENTFSTIPWYSFLIVIGVFFLGLFLFSVYENIVYRSFTDKMNLKTCFFNSVFGNLGSHVTPLKIGHFPLMLYYQYNIEVPFLDTLTGFVKSQLIQSLTSILVYTVAVILLASLKTNVVFFGTTVYLWSVVILGLVFHLAVFIVNVILAYNIPLQKAVVKLVAKIIKKFKKSFDEKDFIQEKEQKLYVFKEQLTIIGKSFYKYLFPALIYFIFMVYNSSYQYLSFLLITKNAFDFNIFLTFYVISLASAYITNVVPVPGGAGTSEVIFTAIFACVIPEAFMGATLLLWRASTFYFVIVIEIIFFIISSLFFKKRKNLDSLQELK